MSTVPPGGTHQSLYRACIREAAAQGRELMHRLVAGAATAMAQRAAQVPDLADRNLLSDASGLLARHEAVLREAYPEALLAEFSQAVAAGPARKASTVSFDTLELMGEDQVQESVESLRTQQLVQGAVEAELTELNALICAAQGLRTVQPERNPLRPEVYVRALRTATEACTLTPAVRREWLLALGRALGQELARCYRELSQMLRSEGVSAAGFTVINPETAGPAAQRAQGGGPAGGGGGSGPGPGGAPAGHAQQKTMLNVVELRRLLAGQFEAPPPQQHAQAAGAPTDFSMTIPAAFEVLQEMRQVDQVMQRLRERQGGAMDAETGMAALRDALRREARSPAQSLALEVVHLMVDNIVADPRLLEPVRAAVRELEPALLRLAMADPRFFSEKGHPARQLVQEMTERSLAWGSTDAAGFGGFIEPLQQAVEVLLETRATGAAPFEFALKTLRETWDEAQRRDRRYGERAVRALLHAEQRNLIAGKLVQQMRELVQVSNAPPWVARFVTGPWTQVMAQARLADTSGSPDPDGYSAVVGDLLWTLQPAKSANNVPRLMRIVPGLVQKLRRGLASIDYPDALVQRFLDRLAEAHRDVLRASAAGVPPAAEPPAKLTREELEAQFAEADEDAAAADAWLAPSEAQESGFITQPGLAPPAFEATQAGSRPALLQDAETLLPDTSLAPGAWLELATDGGWSRWQLTWASPHGTLLMLTDLEGRTHSITRRLAQRMLAGGQLRLISARSVLDGALDAVADAALRNSLDLKL